MKIAFRHYHDKGVRLAEALVAAGHHLDPDEGEVGLVDHDFHDPGWCHRFDAVVLYPHAGGVILSWDGMPPHPKVRLALVHAAGHAEVMRAYGFPVPVEPIGWLYSDVVPARYGPVERALIAPSGLFSADRTVAIATQLIAAGIEVTVRHVLPRDTYGDLAGVNWVVGGTLDHADIDAVDLVIADGSPYCTIGNLAVARGCPMIGGDSDLEPDAGHTFPRRPTHWAEYRHLLRYPYDLGDAPLDDLIAAVTQPDERVEEWRTRMIGSAFDPARAVRLVEEAAMAVTR